MRNVISTENYKGYKIELCYDETPDDPRSWNNCSTFVCKNRNYNFGDRQDVEECADELFNKYVDAKEAVNLWVVLRDAAFLAAGGNRRYEYENETGKHYVSADEGLSYEEIYNEIREWESPLTWREKLDYLGEQDYIAYRVIYLYNHSGLSISLGRSDGRYDRWDTSLIGYAYMEKSEVQKECGKTYWKDWALNQMNIEMEIYSKYVSGEVYGFVAENKGGEHIDSCWGYYDQAEAISDAKSAIDCEIANGIAARYDMGQKLYAEIDKICGNIYVDCGTAVSVESHDIPSIGTAYTIRIANIEGCKVGAFDEIVGIDDIPEKCLKAMVADIQNKAA